MKVITLALNTFKEAARSKVFYLLFFMGILFAVTAKFISILTVGNEARVTLELGLASIQIFITLIAIFTGINLVHKEIDKRTIYNILSKPLHRSHFIFGKFLGLMLTLFIALAGMGVIFVLFLLVVKAPLTSQLLMFFIMLFCELTIVVAISLFFSSFTTPILATIFTITLYVIGHVLWTYNQFKGLIKGAVSQSVVKGIYYLLPNLEKFNWKSQVIQQTPIDPGTVFTALAYALLYTTALLLLSLLIFSRREFK
jgi:ABC-type transport system involved in multi-copper enzyme maturation permease subunit